MSSTTGPTRLYASTVKIRAKRSEQPKPARPVATQPAADALTSLPMVIFDIGGMGRTTGAHMYASGRRDGLDLRIRDFDTDHRESAQDRLPDGTLVRVPIERFVRFGVENPRNAMANYLLLEEQYGRQLKEISVFSTYGGGDGCEPVNAALQYELDIATIRAGIRSELAALAGPGQDLWQIIVGAADGAPQQRLVVLVIGSGCGSVGAAGHILLPYLIRQEAAALELPILLVGVVGGPAIYRGILEGEDEDRTGRNWAATVSQLETLTHQGLHKRWISGRRVDDASPPYDRIILADREPAGARSTGPEVERYCRDLGTALYSALTTGAFLQLEALSTHDRRTPWMTLRVATSDVDWSTVAEAAARQVAARQLRRLAG